MPIYNPNKPYNQDINDLIVDDLIEKGKALPIGTLRTWGGQQYVKHADGWVHVSSGKLTSGKKMEHVEGHQNHAQHKELADKHRESKQSTSSKDSKVEKLSELKDKYKAEGKPHAAKVIESKIKELSPSQKDTKTESSVSPEIKAKTNKIMNKLSKDLPEYHPKTLNQEIEETSKKLESNLDAEEKYFYSEKLELLKEVKEWRDKTGGFSEFKRKGGKGSGNGSSDTKSALNLTSDEKSALGLYQGDSNYSEVKGMDWTDVQSVARGGKLKNKEQQAYAKKLIESMESAINKNSLAKDTTVYRGTSFPKDKADQIKPGVLMTDSGFSSTSKSKNIAQNYADSDLESDGNANNVKIMYQIDLPKGTKAFDFKDMDSAFDDLNEEKEILLNRNMKFKVTEVKEKSGVKHVKLEVVG